MSLYDDKTLSCYNNVAPTVIGWPGKKKLVASYSEQGQGQALELELEGEREMRDSREVWRVQAYKECRRAALQ